jgi:restriction system protein
LAGRRGGRAFASNEPRSHTEDLANHLALASRDRSNLALADVIIAEHAAELTIRRKQLTVTRNYGVVDDSKWLQDVDFFIDELIEGAGGEIRRSPERLQLVMEMIDTAAKNHSDSREVFVPDMDPVDFEQMVANSLTDMGWQTRLTKASGDQGVDVIAEMRGKRVVIQCKRYASPIGNSAVQEAYAGQSFENADYAAVVSNAEFTWSARQLAETTRVILLHHDALSQLDLQIFGSITIAQSASLNDDKTRGNTFAVRSRCVDIVKAHAAGLTIQRKQLTIIADDGSIDDSEWVQEVASFIGHVIEPQTADTMNSLERLKIVQRMIDNATAHYAFERVPLLIDMTPAFYEQAVADGLHNLGWETQLTGTGKDQYADVIAEMRGKRVMIQCWGFVPPCIPTVQQLYECKSIEGADYACIVSNAKWTPSERQMASSTGVVLLRHDNLTQLEKRIFGPDTPLIARIVAAGDLTEPSKILDAQPVVPEAA